MPEIIEQEDQPKPDISLHDRTILGLAVSFEPQGNKTHVKTTDGVKRLAINPQRFLNSREAFRSGIMQAASLAAFREAVQKNRPEIERSIAEAKNFTDVVLRLRGTSMLKAWEPDAAAEIAAIEPEHLTALGQFDYACEQYLLTGAFPEGLNEQVVIALRSLPQKDDGKNPLDFIVQEGRMLQSAINDYYKKYVAPARLAAAKIDFALKKTEREEYVPPQFQGERAPLNPEDVEGKVEPPVYGFYRGRIFRYDAELKRLVAEVSEKKTWAPQQIPENADELTRHRYTWKFVPGKENIIPMPYKSFPFPDTLTPAGLFSLMRDKNGTFSLEPKNPNQSAMEVTFTFLICETSENAINDEPMPADSEPFYGPLDEESEIEIEKIRRDKFLSEIDRSRSLAAFTRNRFTYPEDEEMPAMDKRYEQAGENLRPEMAEHRIANCHWGNISSSLANRELHIPARVPTGFFVTKIKDCDFAAVGGIGHAWSEAWDRTTDPENPKWETLDATPAKKDQKEDENAEEDELSPEDIQAPNAEACEMTQELIDFVLEDVMVVGKRQRTTSDALFKARTEVSPEKWGRVKEFIDAVNKTEVPKDGRITETTEMRRVYGEFIKAPTGTLEREWQKLFAMICEHRKIPRRTFRGPVTQSEGSRLRYPVMAVTDILTGSSDPGGFEVEDIKHRTQLFAKNFDHDVLVDLTASMNDRDKAGRIMRVEQKKVVLGMLNHLMRLNNVLNDSRTRTRLQEPVEIKSEVFGVRGVGDDKGIWSWLKTGKEAITEKLLTQLADELDKTSAGQGDTLSALRAYKENITPAMQQKLKSGELIKILTIYSDGMVFCTACGKENHDYEVDTAIIALVREEVRQLREMGIIVQGVGFSEKAGAIKAMCGDDHDHDAAVVVNDSSEAILAEHKFLVKHLKNL